MAKKKKVNIAKDIREASIELKDMMLDQLGGIAENMISQIMGKAKNLTPSRRLDAIADVTPKGIQEYRSLLTDGMAVLALETIEKTRKELPASVKNKRFADSIDKLPPALRDKLKKRSQLLIDKQIGDLMAVVKFAYSTNEDTTDSDEVLTKDLSDSAVDWLDSTAIEAGSTLTAGTVINDTRMAVFQDEDVQAQMEGYAFMNGDPVTEVCQDLSDEFGPDSGNFIAKDDPNLFRYTPPLHWNCKSWIEAILVGNLDDREPKDFKPSTAKIEEGIQFAHSCGHAMKDQAIWQDWFTAIKLADA